MTETTTPDSPVTRAEMVLSRLLRAGVVASMIIVLIGVLVMFARHPSFLNDPAETQRMTSTDAKFPLTIGQVATDLVHFQGRAIVVLGIFVLIATPVMRVVATIVLFANRRDKWFALMALFVLIVLLLSFALGKTAG
ncbi:MAG: DUF1634 domain-containing protein [Planctomycetes bacterium]|nr:DUF1634 domain-containing protein [Planctomycetota bacterium]